jgi:hypothetical protein
LSRLTWARRWSKSTTGRRADNKSCISVLEGEVAFGLDGEEARLSRGKVVAVTDPAVRRRATALNSGAMLLIVGAADSVPVNLKTRSLQRDSASRVDRSRLGHCSEVTLRALRMASVNVSVGA